MNELLNKMTIKKKLTYSILALTLLLGLAAIAVAGFMLNRTEAEAMRVKGNSLMEVIGMAATPKSASREAGSMTAKSTLIFFKAG